MNYYVHNVPGRLRVKIPELQGDIDKHSDIQKIFNEFKGIDRITINPVTGSIVINYDENTVQDWEVLTRFKENGYLCGGNAVSTSEYGKRSGSKAGEAIGKAVFGWAVGKAFEGSRLSILAAFI